MYWWMWWILDTFHTDTGGVLRLSGQVLHDARVVSGVGGRSQTNKSQEGREVVEVRRNLDELLAFVIDIEQGRGSG